MSRNAMLLFKLVSLLLPSVLLGETFKYGKINAPATTKSALSRQFVYRGIFSLLTGEYKTKLI